MPATPAKNLVYRLALPFMAPSVRGHLQMKADGQFNHPSEWESILCRNHVLGGTLLITDGDKQTAVYTSCDATIPHSASEGTIYRVASITKMATAVVTLLLCEQGAFSLSDNISSLLPDGNRSDVLKGITLESLLCHKSGLRDIPYTDTALLNGQSFHDVLAQPGITGDAGFHYCNFGFGLIGCILEAVTGKSLETVFQETLFGPLGMHATLDGSTLNEKSIMPIERILRYHPGRAVRVTTLGKRPLAEPDPLRHFGHTAGAMYTDAASLAKLMRFIAESPALRLMKEEHAPYGSVSSGMGYGLGLIAIENRKWSTGRIFGHQGYAYGCVDGAFYDEATGRQVIQLNGGASEYRKGRLGKLNSDTLAFALTKELPSWT